MWRSPLRQLLLFRSTPTWSQKLKWSETEELAKFLLEKFPDADPVGVKAHHFKKMIEFLDPELASNTRIQEWKGHLQTLQEPWKELWGFDVATLYHSTTTPVFSWFMTLLALRLEWVEVRAKNARQSRLAWEGESRPPHFRESE